MKRGGPLVRRTRIRRVSRKRAATVSARREAVRSAMVRAGWRCEAPAYGAPGVCWGPCDPHEPLTRARGGSIVDPSNIVIVCRFHHSYLHDNPAWAVSVGLLRSSWGEVA